MSFGSKTTKTNQKTTGDVDPWDETVPYLKNLLAKTGSEMGAGTIGATGEQTAAYDALKQNAKAGNPFAGQIEALAGDQFDTPDRSGTVTAGYDDLQRRLSGTADGKNLSIDNNPLLQKMLTQVADDAQNRISAQFAAAGRDFSGAHQGAVAKGVAQAQTPLLLDFLTREQGRTDQAARDLFNAGGNTATTLSNLDQVRSALRSAGIDTAASALEARDAGPNAILNLEQQLKSLPYEDLSKIAALLFPAAGLGQQSEGTAKGTSTTSGFSLGIGDIGKGIGALGTLFCDRRAKTDVEEIGSFADGTPLYRFRYIGSDELHIGPMAQEVAERFPDAVAPNGPGGLLTVDIAKATERSAAIVRERMGAAHGSA